MERYFNVLLPLLFDRAFTYKTLDHAIKIGDIVKVNFGKKQIFGLVFSNLETENLDPKLDKTKIKEIISKHDFVRLEASDIEFIKQISAYNMAPSGLVLRAFIGFLNSDKIKKEKNIIATQNVDIAGFNLKKLSAKQQEISDKILENIKNNKAQISLIDAVTGSGKTEIYFSIIAEILKEKDAQILIMLPEIALTGQLLSRFEAQFGFKACLWHSKISKKEKREIFYGIAQNKVKVLIGARSALLLPFKNLRLIIIDEEHDQSFKQEEIFNFHARDMAILKAKIDNFSVILSSATPSIESYFNAQNAKYNYYSLDNKFNEKNNDINIIDLRKSRPEKGCYISQILREAIKKNLENKHQTLLFLNRRGYAPVMLCKACGQKVNCPNCSSFLVHHKHSKMALCHYCGHSEIFSTDCKSCNEKDSVINIGAGVEKIKEEIENMFPQARIVCIDSDKVSNFKDAQDIVAKITNNEIDIIIGTQIIAKGYDFPNLTLVGIVDADSGFYSSELKSCERSFQLLSQVMGRAGRSVYHGKIFIQTYNPDNFIFQKIIENDKKGFFDFEILNRKNANMPPFAKMANIKISAFEQNSALNVAKNIVKKFPFDDKIEVFGPAPAPLFKHSNRYNYNIFVKVDKKINLQKLILDVINILDISPKIRVKIDIDPQ